MPSARWEVLLQKYANTYFGRTTTMHTKSTTATREHFSAHASLAALADKLRQMALFEPITQHVHIPHEMAF